MSSIESFDLNEILRRLEEIQSSVSTNSTALTLSNKIGNTNVKSRFKPKFKPKYLSEQSRNNQAINAIIEIRAVWRYAILEASYNYSKMYSKLTIPISDELKRTFKKHKEDFGVYDKIFKKWLIKPEEPRYKFCFNGEKFQEFQEAKGNITVNRLLLVGKYTVLMQEPNLLEITKATPRLFKTFVMPRITLTVGVPGCGKTTYIIKSHGGGSLVLTSCAEGAQDVRARMADKRGGDPSDYKDSYRTIDSYLLNSKRKFKQVWVDEALMEHPGKLFLVCLVSRCSALFLLGDPNQLQYINRLNGVKLLYDKSSMFFEPTVTLNVSYRCPVDVMSIISSKYVERALSASKVLRSLKSERFTSLKEVPIWKDERVKYLVFKQAEKKLMKEAGYDVSTIHEFQGKEAAHVVLVRMSCDLQEPLYRSPAHMLVGMSRHKESFTYYTPVTDDLKILIDQKITAARIRLHQV